MAYNNFKNQKALDDDPKAIQKITFTENLTREQRAKMFFIIEEAKETVYIFHKIP